MENEETLTETQKLGQWIRKKREAKGYSLRQFSMRLFNTEDQRGYISKIERGLVLKLTYEQAARIAAALDTELITNEK